LYLNFRARCSFLFHKQAELSQITATAFLPISISILMMMLRLEQLIIIIEALFGLRR
jgi:hypothetical protein